MKLFQVKNNMAVVDFTMHGPKKSDIPQNKFPEELMNQLFEAPDDVFIGFGYDYETNKWIKPEIPDGWILDETNGTLVPDFFSSKDLTAARLHELFPYVFLAVKENIIDEEQFKKITGEEFVDFETEV